MDRELRPQLEAHLVYTDWELRPRLEAHPTYTDWESHKDCTEGWCQSLPVPVEEAVYHIDLDHRDLGVVRVLYKVGEHLDQDTYYLLSLSSKHKPLAMTSPHQKRLII